MDDDTKTREQAEEDVKEDLELTDDDADKVGGGMIKINLDTERTK